MVNETDSCVDHIFTNNLSSGIKPCIMLRDISDHYPIYLTVSKTRIKRDIQKRFLIQTHNIDTIAFDRDLCVTPDSLPMQH